ncbi:MAG: O-antigen ligase family protein [Candidatus Aminicenantes bacterium]|nr:O-antigen ligase family protein [Candidatus Aminicenantes bacterium]
MKILSVMEKRIAPAVRFWLLAMLVFLPFQLRLADELGFVVPFLRSLKYLDELTVLVLFPPALWIFFRERNKLHYLQYIFWPLAVLGLFGLISGWINHLPLMITAMGSFDYVKNFLPLFIYAAFFPMASDWQKALRFLVITAVVLGVFAVYQESINLVFSLFFPASAGTGIELAMLPRIFGDYLRIGLLRTPSLTIHPNLFGLFTLLVLTYYLFTKRKVNPLVFLALYGGIFFCLSRIVGLSFIVLAGIQFLRGRKWMVFPTIPLAIFLFLMGSYFDSNVIKSKNPRMATYFGVQTHYTPQMSSIRSQLREKALAVFNDHPVAGSGPGTFGGIVSFKYRPELFKKYKVIQWQYDSLKKFGSLDQFWPQLLAELGVVGTSIFVLLLVVLALVFIIAGRAAPDIATRGFFLAAALATGYIFIYLFSNGLNMTAFLYTYSALAGMVFGGHALCGEKQND